MCACAHNGFPHLKLDQFFSLIETPLGPQCVREGIFCLIFKATWFGVVVGQGSVPILNPSPISSCALGQGCKIKAWIK